MDKIQELLIQVMGLSKAVSKQDAALLAVKQHPIFQELFKVAQSRGPEALEVFLEMFKPASARIRDYLGIRTSMLRKIKEAQEDEIGPDELAESIFGKNA